MKTSRDNLETAISLADLGVACIPCHPGTKEAAVRWKIWQTSVPPRELLERWFRSTDNNIAMVCTGLVVFDCDDPEKLQLVIAEAGDTPVKTQTPRGGMHLPFRLRLGTVLKNRVDVKGLKVDIRTNGGIALLPGSETADGQYVAVGKAMHELASLSELPVARIGWTRERKKRPPKRVPPALEGLGESRSHIRFPEAYCLRIPSVQGQNGSKGLVRVVATMREAGRSPQQIFDFVMGVWNAACAVPPWSEAEVRHCVARHGGG